MAPVSASDITWLAHFQAGIPHVGQKSREMEKWVPCFSESPEPSEKHGTHRYAGKPLSGLYLSTVALMWTFCPSRTKAGMPTEPSWKSLQTIPSNLKLRES